MVFVTLQMTAQCMSVFVTVLLATVLYRRVQCLMAYVTLQEKTSIKGQLSVSLVNLTNFVALIAQCLSACTSHYRSLKKKSVSVGQNLTDYIYCYNSSVSSSTSGYRKLKKNSSVSVW